MKFQKIVNFLDTTSSDKDLPRFVTKKWIKVYDQSGKNYNALLLRSHLRDHSDAYIVVKGTITVIDPYNTKRNKSVAFKNNSAFNIAFQKSMVYKLTMQET